MKIKTAIAALIGMAAALAAGSAFAGDGGISTPPPAHHTVAKDETTACSGSRPLCKEAKDTVPACKEGKWTCVPKKPNDAGTGRKDDREKDDREQDDDDREDSHGGHGDKNNERGHDGHESGQSGQHGHQGEQNGDNDD